MIRKYKLGVLSVILFLVVLSPTISASTQGFTVTSVSLSNILHPGDPETNAEWLVQIALNGGGQSLVSTLDKQDISYQGYTSKYPLQISGSTDPEQAFYIINNNQPDAINTYSTNVQKGTLTSFCVLGICHYEATPAPSCQSAVGEWKMKIPAGLWGVSSDTIVGKLCLVSQQIGIRATIPPTPNIQFSSHLNLMANGRQEQLDLSHSQQSATSSGGLVQATWVGSLVTGNAPPSGSDYVAVGTPQGNTWILKPVQDFDSYKTNFNNVMLQQQYSADSVPAQCGNSVVFPGGSLLGGQDLQPYINNYMGCLQTLAQNQYSISNQQANSLITNGVSIGGKPTQFTNKNGQPTFVVDIKDYFVTNPVVVLRFRGDFLGVVIPLGKPKIVSATSECFNSGNKGTIVLNVQNIGNADGSFYPDLSDCSMISSQSPPKYSVGIGQSQNIEIPIFTTGANTNIKQSCTIKVTDYNGGGTDTAQLSICIKEANQCDPNKPVVQGKSICPCKNFDGTYKPATGSECTYCENRVVVDDSGKYVCGAAPSISKPNAIEKNTVVSDVSTQLGKKVLNAGINQLDNARIPIEIGRFKTEITLGQHADEAAKSSKVAFPSGSSIHSILSTCKNISALGAFVYPILGGVGTACGTVDTLLGFIGG